MKTYLKLLVSSFCLLSVFSTTFPLETNDTVIPKRCASPKPIRPTDLSSIERYDDIENVSNNSEGDVVFCPCGDSAPGADSDSAEQSIGHVTLSLCLTNSTQKALQVFIQVKTGIPLMPDLNQTNLDETIRYCNEDECYRPAYQNVINSGATIEISANLINYVFETNKTDTLYIEICFEQDNKIIPNWFSFSKDTDDSRNFNVFNKCLDPEGHYSIDSINGSLNLQPTLSLVGMDLPMDLPGDDNKLW